MKKKFFFDFFNFSEICVIFAQICIFWPFSFFKRVLKRVKKYMAGKKLANDYMFQLIKFWSPKPKFHAKNQNSLGGGGKPGFPPLPFSNRDFSHQILKRAILEQNRVLNSKSSKNSQNIEKSQYFWKFNCWLLADNRPICGR